MLGFTIKGLLSCSLSPLYITPLKFQSILFLFYLASCNIYQVISGKTKQMGMYLENPVSACIVLLFQEVLKFKSCLNYFTVSY